MVGRAVELKESERVFEINYAWEEVSPNYLRGLGETIFFSFSYIQLQIYTIGYHVHFPL